MCENEATAAHSCIVCERKTHAICGVHPDGEEEGYGSRVICNNCREKTNKGETMNRNSCKDCQGINFIIQVFIYLLVGPNTITKTCENNKRKATSGRYPFLICMTLGIDVMLIHSLNTYTLLNFTDIQPWWMKPKVAKVSAAGIKKDPTNNWGIYLTCFRRERYHTCHSIFI